MNRGYLKLWRKIEDSVSWNRGLVYQGLMINFLRRANWKKSTFQGIDVLPGQFAISMTNLAVSLNVPRSTLQRMVAHLETDDFVTSKNMGNRFVVFTIINWHTYQHEENLGGQPTGNQRLTNGQPVGTSKEDKNISIKNKDKREDKSSPVGENSPTGANQPFCPHEKIIAMYHEQLPELPRVRVRNDYRDVLLRTRWKESLQRLRAAGREGTREEGLAWWHKYFALVRASPLLMGQVEQRNRDSPWAADFEWLIRPKNFTKVIEGRFLKRKTA